VVAVAAVAAAQVLLEVLLRLVVMAVLGLLVIFQEVAFHTLLVVAVALVTLAHLQEAILVYPAYLVQEVLLVPAVLVEHVITDVIPRVLMV
jgi:hypothetical protein